MQTTDGQQMGEPGLPIRIDDFRREQLSFPQHQCRSPAMGNRLPAPGEVLPKKIKDAEQIFIGIGMDSTVTGNPRKCKMSLLKENSVTSP